MQMKLIVTGFSFPGLVFAKEKVFLCASTDLDEFQIYTIYTLSWNFKWHEVDKWNESDFWVFFLGGVKIKKRNRKFKCKRLKETFER